MKARLSVYLDPPVMAALAAYAARRDKSLSIIAEAAIGAFVAPEGPDRLESALSRRLDRQARQIERLERDVGVSVEMLALFVRFWLTVTPQSAERSDAAARAIGKDRFEGFVAALGRRLAAGRSLAREVRVEGAGPHDAADLGVG